MDKKGQGLLWKTTVFWWHADICSDCSKLLDKWKFLNALLQTSLRKLICMSTLIYVLRHFWYFTSCCIKRNSYGRPKYHHIVKISGIFVNMNLCILNQYPNTNTIIAKLVLSTYKSVWKVSVFKKFLLTQISSWDALMNFSHTKM